MHKTDTLLTQLDGGKGLRRFVDNIGEESSMTTIIIAPLVMGIIVS